MTHDHLHGTTSRAHNEKELLPLQRQVIDKLFWRIIVFIFILFLFSFLDRINIGFAGLTMGQDIGLTATEFGLASSLFYIAYVTCGVPSNMILARVGAKFWIGFIMILWGFASTATMFATGPIRCTCCASWWASPKPDSCPASCST